MAIPELVISVEDQETLVLTYRDLLARRDAMMAGLAAVEGSAYRGGLMVDALIAGLMAHFHEVARNPSAHVAVTGPAGGSVGSYAKTTAGSIAAALSELPPRLGDDAPNNALPKRRAAEGS